MSFASRADWWVGLGMVVVALLGLPGDRGYCAVVGLLGLFIMVATLRPSTGASPDRSTRNESRPL